MRPSCHFSLMGGLSCGGAHPTSPCTGAPWNTQTNQGSAPNRNKETISTDKKNPLEQASGNPRLGLKADLQNLPAWKAQLKGPRASRLKLKLKLKFHSQTALSIVWSQLLGQGWSPQKLPKSQWLWPQRKLFYKTWRILLMVASNTLIPADERLNTLLLKATEERQPLGRATQGAATREGRQPYR